MENPPRDTRNTPGVRLAVTMLLKRRGTLLRHIVDQARQIADDYWVVIGLDSPLTAEAERGLSELSNTPGICTVHVPPVLDRDGDHFHERRNVLHETIEHHAPFVPTHAAVWDDDNLLLDLAAARHALRSPAELVYGTKVYLWDDPHVINLEMPTHRSVFFWRWRPGDRHPRRADGTLLHRPRPGEPVADLQVLDNGSLNPAEREQVFADFAAAGKIDPMTTCLLDDPKPGRMNYENTDVEPEWMVR